VAAAAADVVVLGAAAACLATACFCSARRTTTCTARTHNLPAYPRLITPPAANQNLQISVE
jgi:hypothetical protein